MGFGVLPVGLEHDLSDDAVASVFAEAAPRAAFATDASAGRLLRLRRESRLRGATVIAEGLPEEDGLLPLAGLLGLAAVLDTPRAGPGLPVVLAPGQPREPRPVARGGPGHRAPDPPGRDGAGRSRAPGASGERGRGRLRRCSPRHARQAPRNGGLRGRRAHHDGPGAREPRRGRRRRAAAAQGPGVGALGGRRLRRPGPEVAGRSRSAVGAPPRAGRARGKAALGRGGRVGVGRDRSCARRRGRHPRRPGWDVEQIESFVD